jgi:phasin family protein
VEIMSKSFDDVQKFGKEQFEAASTAAVFLAKGFQTLAAETTDYSKKSFERNSAFVEKLLSAKSLDAAIETQTEYAKSAYEGFVSQATKIGELYTSLAKEAFKPVQSLIAKVQAAAEPAKVEIPAAEPAKVPAAVEPVKVQPAAEPAKVPAAAARAKVQTAGSRKQPIQH